MQSLDHLIDIALDEDIGPGDITTEALVDPALKGEGAVIARQPLVIAGIEVARRVFHRVDSRLEIHTRCADGDELEKDAVALTVQGSLAAILTSERTALNFLQRLSGIATHVRAHCRLLEGTRTRLVDTRKTAPGWRVLEKYAVRIGGASNHRMGLYDGVLIKDNHIAACGGIGEAVRRARRSISHLVKIEVEVTTLSEVEEALAADADVIMLDNMSLAQIEASVRRIGGRTLVEVSGRVQREDLRRLAGTGVDLISMGALTHSAPSVDLSLEILPAAVA